MEKALVAVSGGSDSLALLDMLYKQGKYELIVCHVNYNYRVTSKRDEEIVRNYTKKKNIKCYVLNLKSHEEKEGNFEDWARVKRYKFFKEIYDKENCICLFVGHQKDDVIETYLIQKSRNAIVENYGLSASTNIQNMNVLRPLLNYTKQDLENYCVENKIKFGVDETNFDLNYSRNKIRHEVVDKLSNEEKDKIIQEINTLNEGKYQHTENIKSHLQECLISKNKIDLNMYNRLDYDDKKEVLYYFLISNVYKKISIKKSRLEDIIKKIASSKPNIILATYDNLTLFKEYNLLVIEKNNIEYCYKIETLEYKEIGGAFIIDKKGKKLEKVIVNKNDFPLYIKNYDGNNKTINREFINRKVPLRERKQWPTIVDKFGRLLLVIGIKKFYNEIWDFEGDLIEFYVCKSKGE